MLLFQVTYKALEQFSESDFDLEKLEKTVHYSWNMFSVRRHSRSDVGHLLTNTHWVNVCTDLVPLENFTNVTLAIDDTDD